MRRTGVTFVVDCLDDGKVRLRVMNGTDAIDTYHLPVEVAGVLSRQLTDAIDQCMAQTTATMPVKSIQSAIGNH